MNDRPRDDDADLAPGLDEAEAALGDADDSHPAEDFVALVDDADANAAKPRGPQLRSSRGRGVLHARRSRSSRSRSGLFVFNSFVMPRFIHGEAEVRVPDLTNLTLDQAEKQVAPLRLQLSRAGERFDPAVPSGFILSQDPPEGTPVRGRHRVMVMVSLGEEFSSVPALFGESQRGARLLIERAGCASAASRTRPPRTSARAWWWTPIRRAETVLPRGAPVACCSRPASRREELRDARSARSRTLGRRRQLEALGFRVVTPAGAPVTGAIVFQDPPAGSRITRDATHHAAGHGTR